MVLTDLGRKITSAYSFSNVTDINEEVFENMLVHISTSLLQAGVNSHSVEKIKENLRNSVKFDKMTNRRIRITIKKRVFQELVTLMTPGVNAQLPVKGKSNVIMLVGLENVGTTSTCMKLAQYYSENNWKVCVVGADAVGVRAYDQLTEKASSIGVSLYRSNLETDPIIIAQKGVEKYKNESFEIIIVDASESIKEDNLFREMLQLSKAIKPDNIVLVIDAMTGEACKDQIEAFKEKVDNGSVIVTKLDIHINAAGTLSAVAATNSPIIFVGTGEGIDYFEPFAAEPFVRKLLGMGDVEGLMRKFGPPIKIHDKKQLKRIREGKITLRNMYIVKQKLRSLGPLSEQMKMLPGFSDVYTQTIDEEVKIREDRFLTILGCMNDEELDHSNGAKLFSEQKDRITRVALEAGVEKEEVEKVIAYYTDYRKDSQIDARFEAKKRKKLNSPVESKLRRRYKKTWDPEFMRKIGGNRGLAQVRLDIKKISRKLASERKMGNLMMMIEKTEI